MSKAIHIANKYMHCTSPIQLQDASMYREMQSIKLTAAPQVVPLTIAMATAAATHA